MRKFEKEFRADNPQTIGENDKEFDNANYIEWLENKLMESIVNGKTNNCEDCGKVLEAGTVFCSARCRMSYYSD